MYSALLLSRGTSSRFMAAAARRCFHQSAPVLSGDVSENSGYERAGKRERVGFGLNGEPIYVDRLDYPFPAIRFRVVDDAITRLREKEKGDWKNLSIEDKKALYRASFCQTISEVMAPTGTWKVVTAMVLVGLSAGMWLYTWVVKFVYPPLPETFSEEWREAALQRMIDLHAEPITGPSSKWDYENNRWKA